MESISFISKIKKENIEIDGKSVISDISIKWSMRLRYDFSKVYQIDLIIPDQDITVLVEDENESGEVYERETSLKIIDAKVENQFSESSQFLLGIVPVSIQKYRGEWTICFYIGSV